MRKQVRMRMMMMMFLIYIAWIQGASKGSKVYGASKGSKAFGKKLNVEARNNLCIELNTRYRARIDVETPSEVKWETPASRHDFPAAQMATSEPPAARLGWG
nr:hypothetical protein [Tanacetum cinerariifolium]